MVREALVARARSRGRLLDWNRACADMLSTRDDADGGRLGRHLLAAQRWEEAIAPLDRGIDARFVTGPFSATVPLLEGLEHALQQAGLPDDDPRHGEPMLWRARYENMTGHLEDSLPLSRALEQRARARGWTRLVALSLREQSWTLSELGRLEEAEAAARQAIAFGRDGSPQLIHNSHRHAARALLMRGHIEEAEAAARRVIEAARELSDGALGDAWGSLGQILMVKGQLDEAQRCMERAQQSSLTSGNRESYGSNTNSLGEIARHRGDLAGAEALYREAFRTFAQLGSALAAYPRLNLGLVLVTQGRHEDAAEQLEPLLPELSRQGRQLLHAAAELALCVGDAAAQRWALFDDRWSRCAAFVDGSGSAEPDLAELAEAVATAAAPHDPARARAAWALAARCWTRTGRGEAAAAAEARSRDG
jgi:tetratricopeptide (TPR) repeat protein